MIAFPVSHEPAKEASVYMKLLEMKEEKENSEVKMKGPNQRSLAITWPPHHDQVPSSTQVPMPGRNALSRHVQ